MRQRSLGGAVFIKDLIHFGGDGHADLVFFCEGVNELCGVNAFDDLADLLGGGVFSGALT